MLKHEEGGAMAKVGRRIGKLCFIAHKGCEKLSEAVAGWERALPESAAGFQRG